MNRKFGLGRVLAIGIRIWAKNVVPFVALTAAMHAPLILWSIVLTQGRLDYQQMRSMDDWRVVSMFVVPLLNILVSAVLTFGVVMQLQGKRVSIYSCIATGFRRFFPALGAMILVGLCILGGCLCAALPAALGGPIASAIAGGIAALWVHSVFFVSTQASVLERTDVGDALARSRVLTRGHRLAIAALQLLVLAIALGSSAVIALATRGSVFSPLEYRIGIYLDLARSVLVGSFYATLTGVVYHLLRAEKEGASADELVEIFD